jgi:hypothetical protein
MPRIHDAFVSTVGIGLLVGGLTAINADVRRHVVNVAAGDAVEMGVIAAPFTRAARLAFETMSDYQSDNGVLVAFAVAAIVLFGFLFKT